MTVQGPVKEQQPDGMSHRGGGEAQDPTGATLHTLPPYTDEQKGPGAW